MDDLSQRVQRAQRGGPSEITALVHDASVDVLSALLHNPFLQEEHLLTLLNRKDLPGQFLEDVARNPKLAESQRVKAALVMNPKTPRLVSLGLMKFLFLFDLVAVTLKPAVPPEIKRLAENQIASKAEQIPAGQQVSLARRGSARVAAALLLKGKLQAVTPALDNPYMTEGVLFKVMQVDDLREHVIKAVAKHRKWSLRYDLRLQVVRHPNTPLGIVLEFLPKVKPQDLKLLLTDKRMNSGLREYLEAELASRRR